MKIIFLGLTGVHHALIAGYYYLNGETIENLGLQGFADVELEKSGFPILLGVDENNNQVYALGCETDVSMMEKTIAEFADILGSGPDQLLVLPISIAGEKLLLWLTILAGYTGAGQWYNYCSRFLVKKELPAIIAQVYEMRGRLPQQLV